MATYTDNYTMTKPTYAEQADISVINANMDIIDNVMHSSQISLAPAYDINETYNTGDIVMHELLMYKCLEDNVTGAWDSTKWTRTTAGEESGGGADLDIYGEASGTAEASFSDGAEASLVECEIGIELIQSGSGTPSPSNIRPISGHTDVTVTVASTSGGSGEDTTVSLGRTVYKGWVNLSTGEGAITGEYFNLSNAGVTYYKSAQTNCDRFYTKISDIATDMDISGFNNAICDYFDIRTYQSDAVGTFYIQTGWINIQMPKDMFATGGEFKTWIESESVHLVYELATPQIFNLTPTQVETLLGQNYVSHDGGGTISLVYVKGNPPIVPNPSDADIPLTGLGIDGKGFIITDGRIPAPPTTNGAYVLTVTVSGGTPTYSWENA